MELLEIIVDTCQTFLMRISSNMNEITSIKIATELNNLNI